MYIAIDVIISAIIAAVIIGAVKRGFVRSIFKLGGTALAIVIASVFYKELALFLSDTFVLPKVAESVSSLISDAIPDTSVLADPSQIMGLIPEQIRETLALAGIDIEEVLGNLSISGASFTADAIGDSISQSIASALSNVLAFAALFFGSLIILSLLGKILDKIAKLPVLNTANRFLGFLLGAVEAFVLGILLSKVAEALCGAYGAVNPDFAFTDVWGGTYVAKFFIDVCPW